jgi:hypothetical protein
MRPVGAEFALQWKCSTCNPNEKSNYSYIPEHKTNSLSCFKYSNNMRVRNKLIIQQFSFDHACLIARQQKWQIRTVGINTGIAKIKIK